MLVIPGLPSFATPATRTFAARATQAEEAAAQRLPVGKLVSFEKVQEIPQDVIEAHRAKLGFKPGDLPPLTNGCVLYAVKYVTNDLRGNKVVASGLTIIPDKGSAPAPLLSFQHGTAPGAHNGPSESVSSSARVLAVVAFGGTGHVASLPDYLGFGAAAEPNPERFADPKLAHAPGANQQRVFHPYLHAESEASASLDMLRATRELATKLGVALAPQLFLAGYSQGGQATMALHRLLESTAALRQEFPVTASAPMAGPHDILGTIEKSLVDTVPRSAGEFAYGLLSYDNRAALRPTIDEIFASAHAEQIWKNFSDAPGTSWTEGILGVSGRKILSLAFVLSVATLGGRIKRDAPLGRLIASDHTDKWAASAPIRLVHGNLDKEVSYEVNGQPVVASMRQAGSRDIDLITVPGDHVTAVLPALAGAAQWLATQRPASKLLANLTR